MKRMIKAYMFKYDGSMFDDLFDTEEQAERFCENHELELFSMKAEYVAED